MTRTYDIIGRGPSLADTLALRLREEIASGRLRPGERLPTEQQIAGTYGVSRPIVREAVGRLKRRRARADTAGGRGLRGGAERRFDLSH